MPDRSNLDSAVAPVIPVERCKQRHCACFLAFVAKVSRKKPDKRPKLEPQFFHGITIKFGCSEPHGGHKFVADHVANG